jgi:Ca2+-binding RTX toxin-like protein
MYPIVIATLDGADEIYLSSSNGAEYWEEDSKIYAGVGADIIRGSNDASFRDEIWGGGQDDTIDGHAGDDGIHGDAGDDVISGGADDDHITGGVGADTIDGDGGDDEICAGMDANTDTIDGGAGSDDCWWKAAHDSIASCNSVSNNHPPVPCGAFP